MSKEKECYHINFVSIFNSDRGCAYCPDCGKSPLSYEEACKSITGPAQDAMVEALMKDLVKDILSEPPTAHDDLHACIKLLVEYYKDYPYLNQDGVSEWIEGALELLSSGD